MLVRLKFLKYLVMEDFMNLADVVILLLVAIMLIAIIIYKVKSYKERSKDKCVRCSGCPSRTFCEKFQNKKRG